jgi:hypothetical protein
METTNKLDKFDWWAAAALFSIAVAAYLPAVQGYYLHTDDYFWSSWGGFSCRSVLNFFYLAGRPLAGPLFSAEGLVSTLSAMNMLRFISLMNVALIAMLMYRWFAVWTSDRWFSLALSGIIITLPPFQANVAFASTAPYGLAITVALMALHYVRRAEVATDLRRSSRLCAAAVLLLTVSFAIYQPAGVFFAAMLMAPALFTDTNGFWKSSRWRMVMYGGVLAAGMVAYFLLMRLAYWYWAPPLGGKYDMRAMVSDYFGRLEWFLRGVLYEVANFWQLFPSVANAVLTASIVAIAIALDFWVARSQRVPMRASDFLTKYVIVATLVPLSYLPSLASSNPSLEYRTYGAIAAAVAIAAFGSLHGVIDRTTSRPSVRHVIMALLVMVGVYQAHWSVTYFFVAPDSAELGRVVDKIRRHDKTYSDFRVVHVIPRQSERSAAERHEFGEPTLRHTPNIRPLIQAALQEAGITRPVRVVFSAPRDATWSEHGTQLDGMLLTTITVPPSPAEQTLTIDLSAHRFDVFPPIRTDAH